VGRKIQNGVHPILESSCVTNARQSIEIMEFTSPLLDP